MQEMFNISINVNVSIPVIGDESIMLVQPPDGFRFSKIALKDYTHKEEITDSTGKLLSEYRFALHEDDVPYIVCLEMNDTRIVSHDKPANAIGFFNGTDFDNLISPIHEEIENIIFKFFSMLHLFKEGEIARKHSFYSYYTQAGICKVSRNIKSYIEDIVTLIRYPMKFFAEEIPEINSFLYTHDKSYMLLKPIVINELEFTYHNLDDATNYKNMVTPLEVLFLKNDYGDKKEMLSKRIATFLGTTDAEMKSIYDKVKTIYRDRSEAVHEGEVGQITHSALDELRELTRKISKQYIYTIEQKLSTNPSITFEEIKTELINSLKNIVTIKNNNNIW